MFPATIAVALITGFPVSTTIFASGLATICFILVTGRKIPLYYGSSFSYLSAILGLLKSADFKAQLSNEAVRIQLNEALEKLEHGDCPPTERSYFLCTVRHNFVRSHINCRRAFGQAVRHKNRRKILPASVTGPVAMVIGLTLAGKALTDAAPTPLRSVRFYRPVGSGVSPLPHLYQPCFSRGI